MFPPSLLQRDRTEEVGPALAEHLEGLLEFQRPAVEAMHRAVLRNRRNTQDREQAEE